VYVFNVLPSTNVIVIYVEIVSLEHRSVLINPLVLLQLTLVEPRLEAHLTNLL
jgi:hypothetical protein